MMQAAPASCAAIPLPSPRWPGPRITIVSPSPRPGTWCAQRMPAPIGLNNVAISGAMSLEILCTIVCGSR